MENDFKTEFYKRLIKFSLENIKFCQEIREDRNYYAIADQLIRSATSIGANVVEAKSCNSKKDYLKFFQIALRSANETKYWLIIVREADRKHNEHASRLLKEADEIARILASGVITMKKNI